MPLPWPSSPTINDTLITQEVISGKFVPVYVTPEGNLGIANSFDPERMPAVGVVTIDYSSGQSAVFTRTGKVFKDFFSGYVDNWSGYIGKPLYIGSGEIILTSSLTSGMEKQRIGTSISGGMLVSICTYEISTYGGLISGYIAENSVSFGQLGNNSVGSGNIISGQIGTLHLANSAISSVKIASGAVVSGKLGNNAIISGNIASGQIGKFHISSGTIDSSVGPNIGTVSLNFGSIGNGSPYSSIDVIGQNNVKGTSSIQAWLSLSTTPEHGLDDLINDPVLVTVGNIVSGVGFTVYGRTIIGFSYGNYSINWSWV